MFVVNERPQKGENIFIIFHISSVIIRNLNRGTDIPKKIMASLSIMYTAASSKKRVSSLKSKSYHDINSADGGKSRVWLEI